MEINRRREEEELERARRMAQEEARIREIATAVVRDVLARAVTILSPVLIHILCLRAFLN